MDPYHKRVRTENNRYHVGQKQNSNQQGVVWQHWRAFRRLFTCERGAWADKYDSTFFSYYTSLLLLLFYP